MNYTIYKTPSFHGRGDGVLSPFIFVLSGQILLIGVLASLNNFSSAALTFRIYTRNQSGEASRSPLQHFAKKGGAPQCIVTIPSDAVTLSVVTCGHRSVPMSPSEECPL